MTPHCLLVLLAPAHSSVDIPGRTAMGGAIMVVTIAIITNIAKKVAEITFRSSAMLSKINSTSPRVFINVPSVKDSFQDFSYHPGLTNKFTEKTRYLNRK